MISTLPLPATIRAGWGEVLLRRADADDLEQLVRLLSDDAISASRGDRADPADIERYAAALDEVVADGSNELVVGVDGTREVVAMMQLTRIPGVSRRGATRLQIEAVRVARARRSGGLGSSMITWALDDAARAVGAGLVQLTSDATRTDAHRFYEGLGFTASHVGFKRQV